MNRTVKLTAMLAAAGVAAAGVMLTRTGGPETPAQAGAVSAQSAPADAPVMHVTKTPTCGCCSAWVDLARARDWRVEVEDTPDYVGMKQAAEVPERLWACHTAKIAGYTVEGHVPFEAIRKLLDERPDIEGISVPGMPAGSPGMGTDPDAVYDVIAYGGAAGDGAVFYTAGR
ncbi:DUF411 domain-containing protein [Roseovarius salinarum]|uniref:DUF411 domain-containing protein n=1 Tax=Roseovarius salinarum TaxID=1981892 RepID=UPI001E2ED7FA|nr:DUF411 domain-containing protein [Roseovarius salinarum]